MEWIVKHKKWFEITGWILFAVGVIWAWRAGLFTDTEKLQALLEKSGILAPLLFVIVQAVQVVIPIMPGAIGCVFGVVFFGALWGFVFNYIGICIGSVCAFLLARKYGMMFVQNMTGSKFYNKYQHFLEKENQFEKMFGKNLVGIDVIIHQWNCRTGINGKFFHVSSLLYFWHSANINEMSGDSCCRCHCRTTKVCFCSKPLSILKISITC